MFCNYDFKSMKTIECDTLVVGGGVAGSTAAISSARCGAKTVLVEADGTLGGQAGIGLVTPLSSEKDTDGTSFGGFVKEIMQDVSNLTEKYVSVNENRNEYYPLSPCMTKYALIKKAYESGVNVLFHTVLCDVETDENKVVSAILHDKSGYLRVIAKNFIDASGDADLITYANDNYVLGSEPNVYSQLEVNNLANAHCSEDNIEKLNGEGEMQPVSLFFIMRGVDVEQAIKLENKKICFGDYGITREEFDKWEFVGTEGFTVQDNRVPTPQNRVLVTRGRHSDEAVVNMSRIININGADGEDLSNGEIRAQLQLIAIVDFLQKFVPGFKNSYLVETSSHLGVRESKRLVGRYVLTGSDVINCKRFSDAICRAHYIIDIHDPKGKTGAIGGAIKGKYYEVPFGAVCSKKYNNLLACGRCISSDHVAHSASRIQGCCILTGQAVGTAAAIATKHGVSACDVDVQVLRNQLILDGVYLD